MANQQRVQAYLEQHKIGALFEELMGKVISDQPDEPVIYLIRALQRRAVRMGLSLEPTHTRKSTDHGVDGMAVPKERAYDKPWQSNAKRPPGTHPTRKSGSKPDWNADTKVKSSSDLDDLWGSKDEGQMKKLRGRSPSPARRATAKTTSTWQDADDDAEYLYSSYGYSGPRRQETGDPLEGEFGVSRQNATEEEHASDRSLGCKHTDMRSQTERHRAELQKLILSEKRKPAEDSGIDDDRDLDAEDEAVELMENLDDLRNEGVTNVKNSSGKKSLRSVGRVALGAVRLSARMREVASGEPPVRVSICARCAKVMSGEPSTTLPPSGDYEQEDYPQSRPQSSVRFSPAAVVDSDEEFESVSQVTGPRKPVWQDDSDAENVTPRKGAHMFASSSVPAKGRPMFSPEAAGRTAQSQDFPRSSSSRTYTKTSAQADQSQMHHTWSPEVGGLLSSSSSDQELNKEAKNDTKTDVLSAIEEEAGTLSQRTTGRQGGGWQIPDDESEATSFYGSPGYKGKKQYTGAY